MGLCESNLIKKQRQQLFSLYLAQPRSTLYLRGRFILKEKKNRSQIIQDFTRLTPSFHSKLSATASTFNSIADFAFDQTGYRGYRDVQEFKNKRLLVRRPLSNTVQVYRLLPFYEETRNPELSQFRLENSPLLLEAEYVFAKEQFLLLGCSFVESSSKIICFVQEQSNNAISCKLIRLKPSHNQGTRTVIDNFVLKKYIEEVTTGQYLEVNQIATGMNFVTVEDIEYHKKFFRSECFLWGAEEVKCRRPHILQDFLTIVDRKTPKETADPNDVDSVFSYESEAGVRKTSFYSQSGVTEAEELVAEIRSKKTSSEYLHSSHLLKKSSITSQYIGQLHFESEELLELSAAENKCRSFQNALIVRTFRTIDEAAGRAVCELYVYFKESRVLTIYSTYGGALYEDNSFLISQKIKTFIVVDSKLVLVSYEKLPLIEILNLTEEEPRKEMGVNFLEHQDGRALASGITEIDLLVSLGVVQFGTSRKHIHRNKPVAMPIKVAMSGLTRNAKSYLSVFNCSSKEFEYVRIFDRGVITALTFGPFDNGPILTGWHDGSVRYFGAYSLELLGVYEGHQQMGAISQITFDPLNHVYACSDNSIIGIEAMKGVDRYEYLYIDIPRQKPRESKNTTETSYSYLAPRRGTIIIQKDELIRKQTKPINHEDDSVLGRRDIKMRSETV